MGEAFVQGITSRVDDIARRVEIWFPDFEMNNVAALRFKCLRLHQHFKRGLGPETRHTRREAEFALCSFMHRGDQRLCADEVKMPVRLAPQLRKGVVTSPRAGQLSTLLRKSRSCASLK